MKLNIDAAFAREQKKIQHCGTEYLVQNVPLKVFYEMQEKNRDQYANPLATGLYDEIFKNIIISPKVTWDNFDNPKELEGLMKKIFQFLSREEQPYGSQEQGQAQENSQE